MDNYISEQYKQYPSFTVNQLMEEYESNIVNADKNYTGKTVIVSGIINSFGKTNHDSNLCVLLKSGKQLLIFDGENVMIEDCLII